MQIQAIIRRVKRPSAAAIPTSTICQAVSWKSAPGVSSIMVGSVSFCRRLIKSDAVVSGFASISSRSLSVPEKAPLPEAAMKYMNLVFQAFTNVYS